MNCLITTTTTLPGCCSDDGSGVKLSTGGWQMNIKLFPAPTNLDHLRRVGRRGHNTI